MFDCKETSEWQVASGTKSDRVGNKEASPAGFCCGPTTVCCSRATESKAVDEVNESKSRGVEKKARCSNCPMRARYDKNPQSLIGRVWRWHTGFCPGWKSYMKSLSDEERAEVVEKYKLK